MKQRSREMRKGGERKFGRHLGNGDFCGIAEIKIIYKMNKKSYSNDEEMAEARKGKEFEYINLIKPELNDGIEAPEMRQDDVIEVQEQTGGGDTDETES